MPTWGRSFVLALKTIIFGILWGIVGIIIIVIGLLLPMMTNPQYYMNNPNAMVGLMFGSLIFVIIGSVVAALGFYASLIKFTIEEAIKELTGIPQYRPPPVRPVPSPPPPKPITPPSTVIPTKPIVKTEETAVLQYCPDCGARLPPGAIFCPNCGRKLEKT